MTDDADPPVEQPSDPPAADTGPAPSRREPLRLGRFTPADMRLLVITIFGTMAGALLSVLVIGIAFLLGRPYLIRDQFGYLVPPSNLITPVITALVLGTVGIIELNVPRWMRPKKDAQTGQQRYRAIMMLIRLGGYWMLGLSLVVFLVVILILVALATHATR
jgi:hypothetical protein